MDAELIYLVGLDWAEFALRWLHVITAIAWIGSSFYFIALDLGLRKDKPLPEGVHGEEWQVHGGGFYHIQKYLVAPAALPEHLTWFKWESYATWLSGFALMAVVYYLGADLYLVDLEKAELPIWAAIGISLGVLAVGWLGYDLLCKSPLGQRSTLLMLALYLLLVVMAYLLDQIFTGRAAFLHLGAVTATIMSFNVLVIIIPNQRIVVADLKAGRVPDARYGQIAKQRSTHNNYLTLPVIFFMLSNHYPLAHSSAYSWVIAALVFLLGVSIRHYFNSRHARQGNPVWTWAVTAALFVVIMVLSLLPAVQGSGEPDQQASRTKPPSQLEMTLASAAEFEEVKDIVLGRCSMCHASEPFYERVLWPPKGVILETDQQIVSQAKAIIMQSALSHAMPPANVSYMEPEERNQLLAWYQEGLKSAK
ncbi:MAG: cysteine desulfurase [SAR116 cluster bacterium]|nr:cysteine desulfurase [SAR116 cluster bacterium]HCD64603.1 cysteine desulfurase [Alphaproteobacteria bacterium]|tara:strand:- start:1186 stop:2448 length:1263 start_codon:yes stop_codon:yes gene_type:complete